MAEEDKSENRKRNIRKKLAADGGSQPSKVELIVIKKDYNEKIKYLTTLIAQRYFENPSFYLQKFEFNALNDLIGRDCVWCVNALHFEYNKIQYNSTEFEVMTQHKDMMRINKLFVFHTFRRKENGDLAIVGTYL